MLIAQSSVSATPGVLFSLTCRIACMNAATWRARRSLMFGTLVMMIRSSFAKSG